MMSYLLRAGFVLLLIIAVLSLLNVIEDRFLAWTFPALIFLLAIAFAWERHAPRRDAD
jgi:hypothetical protein